MDHARAGVADHVHAHLALDDARAEALVHQLATGLFAASWLIAVEVAGTLRPECPPECPHKPVNEATRPPKPKMLRRNTYGDDTVPRALAHPRLRVFPRAFAYTTTCKTGIGGATMPGTPDSFLRVFEHHFSRFLMGTRYEEAPRPPRRGAIKTPQRSSLLQRPPSHPLVPPTPACRSVGDLPPRSSSPPRSLPLEGPSAAVSQHVEALQGKSLFGCCRVPCLSPHQGSRSRSFGAFRAGGAEGAPPVLRSTASAAILGSPSPGSTRPRSGPLAC